MPRWARAATLALGAAGTVVSLLGCEVGETPEPEGSEAVVNASAGLSSGCVTIARFSGTATDAIIATDPTDPTRATSNFGTSVFNEVGDLGTRTRQSLLYFDLAPVPAASVVTSATLTLKKAVGLGGGTVNFHRITAPWTESTVTWSSFAGAFDPQIFATLSNATVPNGLVTIDLTGMVQSWKSGVVPNRGFLLEQGSGTGRTTFGAAEASVANRPKLTVCYAPPTCVDGVQNAGETGVDCGGSCPACGPCVGVVCSALDACHLAGTCNSATGQCSNPLAPDNTPCNDANACTQSDVCQAGTCTGTSPVVCAAQDACHAAGSCDPQTGACSNPAQPCCTDLIQNQGEAAVDCGGPCPPCLDATAPVVTITTPGNGLSTTVGNVSVTGTLDEPATVMIGNTQAVVSGLTFSATVPLHEGNNLLAVAATDPSGNTGAASVVVLLDTTPPRVAVQTPAPSAVITSATTTVTGSVQDLVIGTVDAGDCMVMVNGVVAQVSNRGFVATNVPIAEGAGTIVAIAQDLTGNTATSVIQVTGDTTPKATLSVLGGDAQTGTVGTTLPQPLVAKAVDNAGAAVAGASVTFTVTRGDGALATGEREQTVLTDAAGLATTSLTLGTHAGGATDVVTASAPGFLGSTTFVASATGDLSGSRVLVSVFGGNQRAATGALAPLPLTVLLSDVSGNPLQGQTVTFDVLKGGGSVNGTPSASLTTDADGRAYVLLTLGPLAGVNSQLIQASSAGSPPVMFTASTVIAGPAAATAISGVVKTNEDVPIPNVLVSVRGTNSSMLTDAEGHFALTGIPVGSIHLDVDGTTAGPYPPISYELEMISGVDNAMDRPVFLPTVDSDGLGLANPVSDLVLRRTDTPGLVFTVPAGSATFAGVSTTGNVQVIRVHRDKIPMTPPDGTLPSIAFAIMPATAHFDPPAPIRFPNVEGRAPGEVVTIYSFDHDLGEFVGVGSATVTEDGQEIASEPGQGIVKGGWHLVPPTAVSGDCVGVNCTLIFCSGCPATACKRCRVTSAGLVGACTVLPYIPPTMAWAPDVDCYYTAGVPCSSGGGCTPAFRPSGSACIRQYDGNAPATPLGALCNQPGTCQFNSGATKPVCCPGGAWSTSTNPAAAHFCDGPTCGAGHPTCCESACDAAGCCP
jgi:hypothetical protein